MVLEHECHHLMLDQCSIGKSLYCIRPAKYFHDAISLIFKKKLHPGSAAAVHIMSILPGA
jgi:hypothetical protein